MASGGLYYGLFLGRSRFFGGLDELLGGGPLRGGEREAWLFILATLLWLVWKEKNARILKGNNVQCMKFLSRN